MSIEDTVFATLIEAAAAAGGHETGGILIGRYEGRADALVSHATTAPADSRRGYDWFERGTDGLEEILQVHWDAPVRRYYVGEWHFHPAPDGSPSPQDMGQMLEVAAQRRYQCNQPILIIISIDNEHSWLVRIFIFPPDGRVEELTAIVDDDPMPPAVSSPAEH